VVLGNLPFLLSDTVGFIRKLPTQLIESFKSTLDEVREADILVHVLDISHIAFEDHFNVVNETLKDIKALDKPTIVVFNKIDAYHHVEKEADDLSPITRENVSLEELKNSWMSRMSPNKVVFISAEKRINIEEMRDVLYEMVKEIFAVRYPYNNFLY
jgi:GTP-binding protein HflX